MNREELLSKLCLCNNCSVTDSGSCKECEKKITTLLDEYDKHVIAQYEAEHGNLADIIRNIHDCVAREMYCKGIDDMFNEISIYRMYDEHGNVIDVLEIAQKLKEQDK